MEYATQDGDPKLFEPYRKPINDRAAAFRQALIDAEPRQVDALVDFAARAYRRASDRSREHASCASCIASCAHRSCRTTRRWRFTLARVLVSPAFLYRLEKAAPGAEAAAGLRLGTGQPAELFPLVVAARRTAARSWPRPADCTIPTCWPPRRGGC